MEVWSKQNDIGITGARLSFVRSDITARQGQLQVTFYISPLKKSMIIHNIKWNEPLNLPLLLRTTNN